MPKGQKPKPKEIKVLEGNRSKVAQAKLDAATEPKGVGSPRLPPDLDEVETAIWRDIVASLPKSLLTRADDSMLERMAVAWARFRAVRKTIKAVGLLVNSASGPIRNPLLVVLNATQKEMHACASELGLSPVARARLTAAGSEDEDPMALLLGMEDEGAFAPASKARN